MKHFKSHDGKDSTKSYIRVGTDIYKIIKYENRFGIRISTLIKWNRQAFIDDFGRNMLGYIQKFDDFGIYPDNKNHKQKVGSIYNLCPPFSHVPRKGKFKHTKAFFKHIFGDQFEMGIKYVQAMFLHPTELLPILVLVSKERQTGKTTFIEFMLALFGGNAVLLNSEMLNNSFNNSYATKLLILVDEAFWQSRGMSEKLKFLSTTKTILVNGKFERPYSVPFYGKFIIASNNEDNFLNLDSEETRYWVRKINAPDKPMKNLLEKMIEEIPAFLYHLENLPELDWSKSRQLFTPKQLRTNNLLAVVEESKSYAYKELKESIDEFFQNIDPDVQVVYATLSDLKDRFFSQDHKISRSIIKHALKHEFKFHYLEQQQKYQPFNEGQAKNGRPWVIERKYFK